jgi:hypothetical protein
MSSLATVRVPATPGTWGAGFPPKAHGAHPECPRTEIIALEQKLLPMFPPPPTHLEVVNPGFRQPCGCSPQDGAAGPTIVRRVHNRWMLCSHCHPPPHHSTTYSVHDVSALARLTFGSISLCLSILCKCLGTMPLECTSATLNITSLTPIRMRPEALMRMM